MIPIGRGTLILTLLFGTSALAGEPRSAIPWLSHSIELSVTAPPKPRPNEIASADETITVTPLGEVSRDAVGLLAPDRTGFSRDLWGPTSADSARALLLGHPGQGVPEAQALFHRLLVAETDPPKGAGPGSAVLVARIDRLLEFGALEEADALIALAGPDSTGLFRQWFDIGLLLNRVEPPCAALRQNPGLSPTLQARVFCLARGGDWNAAEITLTLGENVGAIPAVEERLLARFLDPVLFEGEADPPAPDPLTALDFVLREAVGLPRPAGALPLAFLHGDLTEHTPMRTRIVSAERLVQSGAIPPPPLFAAYRAGEPAASGGIWDRAASVQALDAALASGNGIGGALLDADAAMRTRDLRVALARDYAPAFVALDATSLAPEVRTKLVELLLLGDEIAAARAAAGPAPAPELVALLSIAGLETPPFEIEDDLTRAAIAGLADRQPSQGREQRLADMLADGRQGEAILAALDLVKAGPAADPSAFTAALFALKQAGQEPAARRIALQTLLLQDEG